MNNNILYLTKSNKYIFKRSQNFLLIGVITCAFFYLGLFTIPALSSLGTISKIIMAASLWTSIFLLPWRYKIKKIFCRKNILIIILLILGIYSIFHTIISDDIWLDKIGNRYLTLFGNPDTALMMMVPVYYFFPEMFDKRFLKILTYTIITSLLLFLYIYLPLVAFIIPFIFHKKYYKCLIIIAIIEGVMFALEGIRIYAIFSVLFVVSYYFLNSRINKKLLFYLSACSIIVFSYLFYQTMISDYSVFNLLSYIKSNNIDNTDTRTFLYRELYEDMKNTKTLLLGKGAYSLYYSDYFYNSQSGDGDFYMRIGAEVGILSLLQKAGFIYVAIYILVFISSIRNALFFSKNKYMKTIGIILALWLLIYFISSLMGHQIIDVFLWCIIGMCHSTYFLNMTDIEWRAMYGNYNKKK